MPRKKAQKPPDWSGEKTLEKPSKLTGKKAKRSHLIVQNDFRADIKEGDDLSGIPERFYQTLKTEKVI